MQMTMNLDVQDPSAPKPLGMGGFDELFELLGVQVTTVSPSTSFEVSLVTESGQMEEGLSSEVSLVTADLVEQQEKTYGKDLRTPMEEPTSFGPIQSCPFPCGSCTNFPDPATCARVGQHTDHICRDCIDSDSEWSDSESDLGDRPVLTDTPDISSLSQ